VSILLKRSSVNLRTRKSHLGVAYRRAGKAFTGQIQQNFGVLYEARPPGEESFAGRQQTKRRLNEGVSKSATAEK
jgi:hypothetical protein